MIDSKHLGSSKTPPLPKDFEDFYICFMIALGTDSESILGPFWLPKSDQIGPKRGPKSIKKVIEKLVEFGIDF